MLPLNANGFDLRHICAHTRRDGFGCGSRQARGVTAENDKEAMSCFLRALGGPARELEPESELGSVEQR